MDIDTDLAHELERSVPRLPDAPATAYLAAGRRASRRRRASVGLAGAAVIALSGGGVLTAIDGAAPANAPSGPATSPPSERIPDWAEEFGNHGPVAIYPNGALWVAPDATLIRSVANPLDEVPGMHVVSSYAAEAEMDGELRWSFVYREGGHVWGEMGEPGEWTSDFDVWIEDVTSDLEHRPSLAEQLVRFADDGSERLEARAGARILEQVDDVVVPSMETHPVSAAAMVTFQGRTWFVLGMDSAAGRPFYIAYEGTVVSASDVEGFLDFLRDRGAGER